MDDQVLDLLIKRMDDHRYESNRRLDEVSRHLGNLSVEISGLKEWKWTTKAKLGIMTSIGGAMFAAAFEYMRSVFK